LQRGEHSKQTHSNIFTLIYYNGMPHLYDNLTILSHGITPQLHSCLHLLFARILDSLLPYEQHISARYVYKTLLIAQNTCTLQNRMSAQLNCISFLTSLYLLLGRYEYENRACQKQGVSKTD
jgi:hypothetical protein